MNNDRIVERLRSIVEAAGVRVQAVVHPSSLRVEFTTSPPLWWNWAQCDKATNEILDAPLAEPDRFGCHPEGRTAGTIGDHFSTDHDRTHSFWRFRLETHPETIVLA